MHELCCPGLYTCCCRNQNSFSVLLSFTFWKFASYVLKYHCLYSCCHQKQNYLLCCHCCGIWRAADLLCLKCTDRASAPIEHALKGCACFRQLRSGASDLLRENYTDEAYVSSAERTRTGHRAWSGIHTVRGVASNHSHRSLWRTARLVHRIRFVWHPVS